MLDELVDLVEGGHEIGAHTVDAVLGAMEAETDVREVFDHVVWRHRGKRIAPKTVMQKRYVDAIRRSTVTFGIGPAGTGKTYLAMALAVSALHEREVSRIILTRPAVEAGRAPRVPARRSDGQGRPVPAPAVRRALRHARPRPGEQPDRERHDRGRSAGVHARAHAQRQLHHPRRGAEHIAGADADVPHASRLRVEGGRDRRRHADRPAARAARRASCTCRTSSSTSTGSRSSASVIGTSSATSSCSESSRRTRSTRTNATDDGNRDRGREQKRCSGRRSRCSATRP